jgi:hypothetical protein
MQFRRIINERRKQMADFMLTKFGYPAKDQKIITTPEGKYLKSYNSIVAFIGNDGTVKVGPNHDYSATTSYYVGKFLNMGLPERRKAIKTGKITEEALFLE